MICKFETLICFGAKTEMKGRTHDLGKDLGWVQNFAGPLLEKPFPAEDATRLLSYGLRGM
jgi:hypothetical protein